MAPPLHELLDIQKGVTAILGSGGKTALMARLAGELPGKILICSTYYYYPLPGTGFLSLSECTEEEEKEHLKQLLAENRAVCAGQMAGGGMLGKPFTGFDRLKTLADYVLVEADDARGYPLKAHEYNEPQMPDTVDDVICVFGADGFMKPVKEVVHHPGVFKLLTGCADDALARPELVAKAWQNERLSKKVLINQVESREALALSERFLNVTDVAVVVGSLKNNAYKIYR
ncbi:MAG: putative selenium-dependent hydroxylase accessory protein YqeC [Lachnospiraceae bacterium]|nr:putative selenium-dependent hydroxylase accessory protein YqeC [Lachnospiraceae bacterium]